MDELNNLTTIGTNSRRGGGQNFDFHHDPEGGKFTVSDAFYAEHDMNNNGLTAHVGGGNLYFSIQSNDRSVSYKGREGYDKGKVFTSTTVSEVLSKMNLGGDLSLTHVGDRDGIPYFRVETIESNETESAPVETETINEEEVVA